MDTCPSAPTLLMSDPFDYLGKNLNTKDEQFPHCLRLKGELLGLTTKLRAMRIYRWVAIVCGAFLTWQSASMAWLAVSLGITEQLGWKFFFVCTGLATGLMFLAVPIFQRTARMRIAKEIESRKAQYSACDCQRFD